MRLPAALLSLLAASSPGATMAGPPDRCCCIPSGGGCGYELKCAETGGTCAPGGQCQSEQCQEIAGSCTCVVGGGPTPPPTPGPTPDPASTPGPTPGPVSGPIGSCTMSGDPAGPEIAMAWVSDQYANFDREYDFGLPCDNVQGTIINQFRCCHDWLVNSFAGINVVSLAFLKPTEILDPAGSGCFINNDPLNSQCTSDGVRKGMPGAIDYFYGADHIDLVFVSIGGATYKDDWEVVLADNATAEEFADKVAAIATTLDAGVEIDYEESANPRLEQLEAFVKRYREPHNHPYEHKSTLQAGDRPKFLTIDFGQGAQFMGPVANWVAHKGFNINPTLTEPRYFNWANAMVGGSRQSRPSAIIDNWYQHVLGYSTLQTKPIAPANLVVSLWSSGGRAIDNCISDTGVTLADPDVVQFITNVEPCIQFCGECKDALPDPTPYGGAYTKGVKGYAYWMVGNISPRRSNTCPSDGVTYTVYGDTFEGDGDCSLGFGAAADAYPSTIQAPNNDVDWDAREY